MARERKPSEKRERDERTRKSVARISCINSHDSPLSVEEKNELWDFPSVRIF